jgi:HAD superfamily hydrolase (TIGR01509 family)
MTIPAAILDVDGTLVDTNYQHALAWFRAFRSQGVFVPVWRIHRHIGMGGDQLVRALGGDEVERERGDDIRAAEADYYRELIGEVELLPGARRLIEELAARGHAVVLASSAKEHEVEHYLNLLDVRDRLAGWTSSGDVETTKPAPGLVEAGIEKAGGGQAIVVGDSTWDVESARRAGVETVAVLTGGYCEVELREAGAVAVFDSLDALRERLDETPLGARG